MEVFPLIWYLNPFDALTERQALDDVSTIVNNDPRWNVLETLLSKPTEHSLEVKVRLEYIDTGTAEELFPRFTGEETMAQGARPDSLFAAEDFTVAYESFAQANPKAYDFDTHVQSDG